MSRTEVIHCTVAVSLPGTDLRVLVDKIELAEGQTDQAACEEAKQVAFQLFNAGRGNWMARVARRDVVTDIDLTGDEQ